MVSKNKIKHFKILNLNKHGIQKSWKMCLAPLIRPTRYPQDWPAEYPGLASWIPMVWPAEYSWTGQLYIYPWSGQLNTPGLASCTYTHGLASWIPMVWPAEYSWTGQLNTPGVASCIPLLAEYPCLASWLPLVWLVDTLAIKKSGPTSLGPVVKKTKWL